MQTQTNVPSPDNLTNTAIDLRKVVVKPLQRRHNDVYMRGLRRPRA